MFIFAHPDDETVACAGTIKRLREKGEEVLLVAVTLGDAGEVMPPAQARLKKLGSVEKLRADELNKAVAHLSINQLITLNFRDGEINNKIVWGALQTSIIEQIDTLKPDIVITFDHTGWYYHLDHVGVSIATTLAFQQSVHRPQALFFSHYQPGGIKWKYVFRPAPATHQVLIEDVDHKLKALDLHSSQDLSRPRAFLSEQSPAVELYELVIADDRGQATFSNHEVFKPIV